MELQKFSYYNAMEYLQDFSGDDTTDWDPRRFSEMITELQDFISIDPAHIAPAEEKLMPVDISPIAVEENFICIDPAHISPAEEKLMPVDISPIAVEENFISIDPAHITPAEEKLMPVDISPIAVEENFISIDPAHITPAEEKLMPVDISPIAVEENVMSHNSSPVQESNMPDNIMSPSSLIEIDVMSVNSPIEVDIMSVNSPVNQNDMTAHNSTIVDIMSAHALPITDIHNSFIENHFMSVNVPPISNSVPANILQTDENINPTVEENLVTPYEGNTNDIYHVNIEDDFNISTDCSFDLAKFITEDNDISNQSKLINPPKRKIRAGVKKIDMKAQKYIVDEDIDNKEDEEEEELQEKEKAPVLVAGDVNGLLEKFETIDNLSAAENGSQNTPKQNEYTCNVAVVDTLAQNSRVGKSDMELNGLESGNDYFPLDETFYGVYDTFKEVTHLHTPTRPEYSLTPDIHMNWPKEITFEDLLNEDEKLPPHLPPELNLLFDEPIISTQQNNNQPTSPEQKGADTALKNSKPKIISQTSNVEASPQQSGVKLAPVNSKPKVLPIKQTVPAPQTTVAVSQHPKSVTSSKPKNVINKQMVLPRTALAAGPKQNSSISTKPNQTIQPPTEISKPNKVTCENRSNQIVLLKDAPFLPPVAESVLLAKKPTVPKPKIVISRGNRNNITVPLKEPLAQKKNPPQTLTSSSSAQQSLLKPNRRVLGQLSEELISRLKDSRKRKAVPLIPPIPPKRGVAKVQEIQVQMVPQRNLLHLVNLDHDYCIKMSHNKVESKQEQCENKAEIKTEIKSEIQPMTVSQPTYLNGEGKKMISLLKINNTQKKKLDLTEYKKRKDIKIVPAPSTSTAPQNTTTSTSTQEDAETKRRKQLEKLKMLAMGVLTARPKSEEESKRPKASMPLIQLPMEVKVPVPSHMEMKTVVSFGVNTEFRVSRDIDPYAQVQRLEEIKPLLEKVSGKINSNSLITSVIETVPKVINQTFNLDIKQTDPAMEHGEDRTIVYLPKDRVRPQTRTIEVQTDISFLRQLNEETERRRSDDCGSSYSSAGSGSGRIRSRSPKRARRRNISNSSGSSSHSSRSPDYHHSRPYSYSRSRSPLREREQLSECEDRRVVYVGRIPDDMTKQEMRRLFCRFGRIIKVSLHFRNHGYLDNYGFVTYVHRHEAIAALEQGPKDPYLCRFEISFGGRREFCKNPYADLDNMQEEVVYQPFLPSAPLVSFDHLLLEAQYYLGQVQPQQPQLQLD